MLYLFFVRGTKKDFTCPQGVLMDKMAYFKEITDGQHLDDVDISVHCDIKIFGWLMHYVSTENQADLPILDDGNIIPVLVSAAFLKVHIMLLFLILLVFKNILSLD